MDLIGARWRKSSVSGEGENDSGCIEVAFLTSGAVAVRDTKDRTRAPHVHPAPEWNAFVAGVRTGEFDRS